MATPLTILASASQSNAATTKVGETYCFQAFVGGAVPRASQAKSTPVDCSAHTTLRGVTLTVTSMTAAPAGGMPTPREDEQGRHDSAQLFCLLETTANPNVTNPTWTLLHTFAPMKSRGVQRVPIALHPDNYVRASWFWARMSAIHEGIRDDVKFTFAITADALPTAA